MSDSNKEILQETMNSIFSLEITKEVISNDYVDFQMLHLPGSTFSRYSFSKFYKVSSVHSNDTEIKLENFIQTDFEFLLERELAFVGIVKVETTK